MNSRKSKKQHSFERICFPASPYMLLQYLLLSSIAEIQKTFFFFHDNICKSIREKFRNRYEINYFSCSVEKKALLLIYYLYLRWIKYRRWPFLIHAEYFICDHLYWGWILGADHDYSLLEDGVGNYAVPLPPYHFSKWRYWLLCAIFWPFPYKSWGISPRCKRLYLAKELSKNSPLYEKETVPFNLEHLWQNADIHKKKLIWNIFGIDSKLLSQLMHHSFYTLLLTQPLSEDRICTEQEKIAYYREIISLYGLTDIIIKNHPREKTDYRKYFPDTMILPVSVPMELLVLSGFALKQAVTICSTSVILLHGKCPIIWTGTEFSEHLRQQWGSIPKPDFL